MGDKNFIKDSGAFIVAFLLGSVTLHGMLYYLITDANDLFSSNNSLLPLLLFIAIYAAFPFGALAVWRHFFVSDKIFRPFQKKDEDKYILIDENVKLLKRFEKIIAITLGISLVFFVLYLILWLLFGKEFEVFYTMAVLGSIISLLAIVPVLFILKKIKLAEGADTITNTTNDAEAIEIRKSFNLEFIIGTAGWFILVAYIISAFWSHTNFEGITNWNLGEGKDAKFKPNKSVQSTLATEKRILNHINDGLGNIDKIENAF